MLSRKRAVFAATGTAGLLLAGALAAQAQLSPTPQGFTDDRSADLAAQIDPSKPRNVILIIGDGMDDSIITAARNYEKGASGRFDALDALPFTGAMTTHGFQAGDNPDDYPIAYVSDSAPTASAWSTGKKTIDGRISQGPSSAGTVPGTDFETVLEIVKAEGKRVGNVSTAEVTDATPAAAAAHINLRACQGPANMADCADAKKSNGGKGSIAEQLVDNDIDVLLGGGQQRFSQTTDAGPTVEEYAVEEHGYRKVADKAGLDAVTSLDGGPVLGLFTAGNMTPEYKSLQAMPEGAGGPDATCETNERGNQPSFAEMTKKAIELLENDEVGFFLQAESAMIDKQEHASDICGAIGDVKALDEAVAVALDFQEENPDTLIIVTSDHAHSTQIVGGPGQGRQTATVKTFDGDPMTVAYSTAEAGSNHTGTQVRVAASGPQAANVTGVIDQTDLFLTMLGRTPSTLPAAPSTPAKPAASVAMAKKVTSKELRKGLQVAVAASSADSVKVTLVKGTKTVASKNAKKSGGVVKLKSKQGKGKYTVVVTATGPGGTTTAKQKVTVKK